MKAMLPVLFGSSHMQGDDTLQFNRKNVDPNP